MARRRKKSIARMAVWLVALALLASAGVAYWLWRGIAAPYQGFAKEGVFVDIPHGASLRTAGYLLERNGVIRSAIAFELYARQHPRRTIVAGEYFFDHPVSERDVFWTLASGKVFEQPFVVREGQTMFDIARNLETGKFMRAQEFMNIMYNTAPIRDLVPRAWSLEGFLFPATYKFPRHPKAQDVANAMVQKFKEHWARIAAGADAPDVNSVATLASLVERETPQPDERPLVAGVFENRLSRRIALQCDPTVIYALERAGQYKGVLSSADLHVDSPYNTYRYRGLPPGPIGNPGEASLQAALAPAETDYLYFVANAHGGHFFAETLAEHNRNVARYRRLMAGRPADPEPPPAPAHRRKARRKSHLR
ncbi:MAG: endolytic transglycosylase MltG [Acidobacteria bacterium]|nr:MAG: endolytic transglycosylase MltG [Acidobacteriota bacterium]